jgi:hypothetical protein
MKLKCEYSRFQEIEIDVDDDNNETSVKKSAKDALLLWCQERHTPDRMTLICRQFAVSNWFYRLLRCSKLNVQINGYDGLLHSYHERCMPVTVHAFLLSFCVTPFLKMVL